MSKVLLKDAISTLDPNTLNHQWVIEAVADQSAEIEVQRISMKWQNEESTKLKAEIERLRAHCKEFIYFEDNPEDYKSMSEDLSALKAENEELIKTFHHFHVNNQEDDFCKECKLYLSHPVHIPPINSKEVKK